VVAIATEGATREKVLGNVQEAAARGAQVVVVAGEDDDPAEFDGASILRVPGCEERISPIVNVLPLQIVAYHIARLRDCDIDKPRNLAKSVTVE
jgi:glucosamine--fructose-6-phosphate aminotransferase (isomerizing)